MASRTGNLACVEILLRHNVDVNASGHYYGTALQAASRVGHIDIVQVLLNANADVNLLQGKYGTALRAAIKGGYLPLVELLLRHGADANLWSEKHDRDVEECSPPLYLAVCQGRYAISSLLLVSGVQMNSGCDADGNNTGAPRDSFNPLNAACSRGFEPLASLLLAHGADVQKRAGDNGAPLHLAASAGNVAIVEMLVDAGAHLDELAGKDHDTALSVACLNGHHEVALALIQAGAAIGGPPEKPNALAAACRGHHVTIVTVLLEELFGSEHEEFICNEAFSVSCEVYDDEIAKVILERTPFHSSKTLHEVCASGLESSLKLIVGNGIELQDRDEYGGHAIHIAASHLQSGIVNLLIEYGADVNESNDHYGNPLTATLEGCLVTQNIPRDVNSKLIEKFPHGKFATVSSYRHQNYVDDDVARCRSIIERLLQHGALSTTELRSLGHAIHIASFIGDEKLVRILLGKGWDVNAIGGYFDTPLLAAINGQKEKVAKHLMVSGANVKFVSNEHATALYLAFLYNLRSTARALIKNGADVNAQTDKHGTPLSTALEVDIRITYTDNDKSRTEFLLACSEKIRIQESHLKVATTQLHTHHRAPDYLDLLVEYGSDQKLPIESVIDDVIASSRTAVSTSLKILRLLVERHGSIVVTEKMLRTVCKPEVLDFLLQQKLSCQIDREILEAATDNEYHGRQLFEIMIDKAPDIPVTSSLVLTALKAGLCERFGQVSSYSRVTGQLVHILLERNKTLCVSDEMLRSAYHSEDKEALLKHRSEKSTSQDLVDSTKS